MTRTPVPEEFKSTPDRLTDRQLSFILSLLDEREVETKNGESINHVKERARLLTKKSASQWIERLMSLPKRQTRTGWIPTPEELPKGHYAIESEDGELRFYNLWRGTRRPEYIKLYVDHGPDSSEVPFRAAVSIINKIVAAGARDCAIRYGREIGHCAVCGIRLTNTLSRELGIGPVCGGRFYADEGEWKDVKRTAREEILARGEDPDSEVR